MSMRICENVVVGPIQISISSTGASVSKYRIESEEEVGKVEKLESIGDTLLDESTAAGKIKDDVDIWEAIAPFTVKNLATAPIQGVNRDITVSFLDVEETIGPGQNLIYDGKSTEITGEEPGGSEFNLTRFIIENPGISAAIGIGTAVFLSSLGEGIAQ